MVRVRAARSGSGSDTFDGSYRLRALGHSAVLRSTFEHDCGVKPDEVTNSAVFPGGVVEGNIRFEVPAGEAGALVLVDAGGFDDSARRFFAVR